jgi:hypothetical protein
VFTVLFTANHLSLLDDGFRAVKNEEAFAASPLLVLSRHKATVMIQAAFLIAVNIAENRLPATIVIAYPLIRRNPAVENAQTHCNSTS